MSGDLSCDVHVQVVDASQSINSVHEQLLRLALDTITTKLSIPIKQLWNSTT